MITPNEQFLKLGQTDSQRQEVYRDLFNEQLKEEIVKSIRTSTNGNFVLGNQQFKDEISAVLNRRVGPGRVGRPRKSH